jgi:penicillin G amidase
MKTPKLVRFVLFAGSGAALLALAGAGWAWSQLQGSLPSLDGEVILTGLDAPAQLSRDALGTAVVQAANRTDAGRALGFAHGQDRFFQMDLLRRRGGGELAGLLGQALVDHDRSARVHRFRERALQAWEREPAARRELLQAYAEGVNAGLASLAKRPWEYLVLRTTPAPWRPEDSFLVLYAMAFDLQEPTGRFDQMLTTVRDQLGVRALEFFHPTIGPADGSLDDTVAEMPGPPGPRVLDLRQRKQTAPVAQGDRPLHPPIAAGLPWATAEPETRLINGSNAFALSGTRTSSGRALLAGDPHLSLRVPGVWYRAQLEWQEDGAPVRVVGASLPGTPGIIIGSNGHIAWSLTNAYVDTGDLVAIDRSQIAPELFYYHGQEAKEFERRTDTILVKGGDPVTVESTWTVWGPIVGETARGKPLAYRWTMHDVESTNLELLELATTQTTDNAIAIAHRSGIPPQNLIIADADGRVAWTIAGRLPKRFGFDGRFPVAWTYGDRGWDGLLAPDEIPVVLPEPGGAIWSANQRHVGGEAGARLGDGGYYEGHRADRIRHALDALPAPVTVAQMQAVQLDLQADWMDRWRTLLLRTLDDAASADRRHAEFRRHVAETPLLAEVNSIGYRLIREWYDRLETLTLAPIFARCVEADPSFNYRYLRTDEALWVLHRDEPEHLLASPYPSWRELRLEAVAQVLNRLDERKVSLTEATWGERNRAAIRHPLSSSLPGVIARRLDLPPEPLAGDHGVPRVQRSSFGASLRLVVAPGEEEEGILHLPGGQSGHPLSPFYRAGHAAWARGEALPLVAGERQHTLTLRP